jgi:hypothetical protein
MKWFFWNGVWWGKYFFWNGVWWGALIGVSILFEVFLTKCSSDVLVRMLLQ